MALRRQNLSPTASLLRNSRLFSLPNPLPRPSVGETFGSGTQKTSDSATLPYPTHQAIATTPTSLARGDWGLKRAIPSRSRIVQTSNPVLQVKQLDTIEHVTDYDSAADHVRTRQKWEELGIPMMRGMGAMREQGLTNIAPNGAFEHRSDVTSYEEDEGLDEAAKILETIKESLKSNREERSQARRAKKKDPNAPDASFVPYSLPLPDPARHNMRRWKYEGPWLPGMNADEFNDYVAKQLHTRRKEFQQVLTQYVKNEIYTMRQNASRNSQALPLDQAEAEETLMQEEKQWSNISTADIAAGIKTLRQEAAIDPLKSKLFQRLIVPFLRLPNLRFKNIAFNENSTKNDIEQYRFDDETTPLSTHPSGGLGYLRTNSYMYNHALLGPQAQHEPVTSRVVQPTDGPGKINTKARLGVAGFVTLDSELKTYRDTGNVRKNTDIFDHITVGGPKVEVLPQFASVSPDGRIHMKVQKTWGAEVLVKKGQLDDKPPARTQVDAEPLNDLFSKGAEGRTLGANSEQARSVEKMIQGFARGRDDEGQDGWEEGESRRGLAEALREERDAPR
ncbi:hypothetical protein CC80DRAFT_264957 [Byssothecium circinans]|uniref:Uncharacterized protein n=1 Tax=Byssothecium circinans TaxID=147558 RepID=A0A6A5U911_9PLEO|nr:hypothetical protein CC80DRAFT_264957 [Byssothecium circinans]